MNNIPREVQDIIFNHTEIHVREVDNFEAVSSNNINILFTTIQGLHSRLNNPCENAIISPPNTFLCARVSYTYQYHFLRFNITSLQSFKKKMKEEFPLLKRLSQKL